MKPFNQTRMELKRCFINRLFYTRHSFNQTRMELKRIRGPDGKTKRVTTFNQTRMELKRKIDKIKLKNNFFF